MTDGFGFLKQKVIQDRLMTYLRRRETIILERRYPAFGNLVPRDVASRAAKERCDAGFGVGETGLAV